MNFSLLRVKKSTQAKIMDVSVVTFGLWHGITYVQMLDIPSALSSSCKKKEQKFCLNIILLSITNKMQRYTIFFITVNALHVSGCFSAHHQELKTAATASGSSKQA
jgi:hypothetical protein